MADYQDYYSQYSSANSKNDEQGGGGGTTGGATETTLAAVRDRLPSVLVGDRLKVDVSSLTVTVDNAQLEIANDTGNPIPISAASLPLPTGAATNTSIVEVRDRLPSSLGAKTAAQSLSVTLSTDGAFATNFGAQPDAAATSDTGSFSLIAFIKRGLTNWTALLSRVPGIIAYQPGTTYSATHYGIPQLYRTVDPTAPPTYTAGQEVLQSCDLNGAALANTRSLIPSRDSVATVPVAEAAVATISVTSTSTTYVRSTTIDLTGYNTITILPNVTAAAGTTGYYKISWSEDVGANWFDETSDTLGASGTPAAGEKLVTQDVVVRQFASGSTGFKSASACTLTKRARYCSISQKSDAAATVTTAYNYQRF